MGEMIIDDYEREEAGLSLDTRQPTDVVVIVVQEEERGTVNIPEHVFGEVCKYLEAIELLSLASSCRFFNRVTQSSFIQLLSTDFLDSEVPSFAAESIGTSNFIPSSRLASQFGSPRGGDGLMNMTNNRNQNAFANFMALTLLNMSSGRQQIMRHNLRHSNHSQPRSVQSPSRALYLEKLRELNHRIQRLKVEKLAEEDQRQRGKKSILLQSFLDCTQVRILIPLPLLSLVTSIILFGLYADGLNISIWTCSAPLLFYFLYLGFCIIIHMVVYSRQSDAQSIWHGLWTNVRGPLRLVFTDLLGGSYYLTLLAIFAALVCSVQVWLVALKLSSQNHLESEQEQQQQQQHVDNGVPGSISKFLPWPLVFLPIWCLLALYCLAPLTRCITEPSTFFIGLVTFWIPFFIFFVCLSIKLDGQERHKMVGSNIRLALIFMPFWLIEGAILITSLLFLLFGIYRLRRGLLERLDEHIGIFLTLWCLIIPFVIFQALLSAKDDGSSISIKAIQTVVPILIIIGFFMCSLITLAIRVRTPFQSAREEQERAVAGSRILFGDIY